MCIEASPTKCTCEPPCGRLEGEREKQREGERTSIEKEREKGTGKRKNDESERKRELTPVSKVDTCLMCHILP